jgi:hypothetical protein
MTELVNNELKWMWKRAPKAKLEENILELASGTA